MKKLNKSLLIHQDTESDTTTSIVIDEDDVVQKTKEFLEKLAKLHKTATVNIYSPLGVVLKAEDKKYSAVAYEKEKYVIVEPNGAAALAKLYGNWNEALACAKKLLTSKKNNEKKTRIVLAQYINKS